MRDMIFAVAAAVLFSVAVFAIASGLKRTPSPLPPTREGCVTAGGTVVETGYHDEAVSTGKRQCKLRRVCTFRCDMPAEAPVQNGGR